MLSQETLPLPRSGLSHDTLPLPPVDRRASVRTPSLLQRILTGRAAPSELELPPMPPVRTVLTPFGARCVSMGGHGGPTVVFESGLGAGKEAWAPVLNALTDRVRVVAYDRAGYGGSDKTDQPRDGHQLVRELRATLHALNLPGPYILVGHSLGGTLMKLYARTHPTEVAGVVLVDARNSDFSKRARHMGVHKLLYEPPRALFMLARPAIRREMRAAKLIMQQSRHAGPFPSVPLMVLTHERAATHWPRDLGRAWMESQRSMAKLSVLGRIAVCNDSGHHVHRDRPDAVVKDVLNVLEAARYQQARRQRIADGGPVSTY
jgi:pimeloyl-ACP methyl ester carboxylesterase